MLIKLYRTIVTYVFSIGSTAVSYQLVNMFAVVWIARLGTVHIAASAIAIATMVPVYNFAFNMLNSVSIITAHASRKGETPPVVGQVVYNSFLLSTILLLPFVILVYYLPQVLLFLGQSPRVVEKTPLYFYYASFAILPMAYRASLTNFLIALGRHRVVSVFNSLYVVGSFLLLYIFVLGHLGFSRLGIAGHSYVIFVLNAMLSVIMLAYLLMSPSLRKYQCYRCTINTNQMKKIIQLGLSMASQVFLEMIALVVLIYFVAYLGVSRLAAFQIVLQYVNIVIVIFAGFAQAFSVLLTSAYAEKNTILMKQYTRHVLIMLYGFLTIVLLIFLCVPRPLIHLFVDTSLGQHQVLFNSAKTFFLLCIFHCYCAGTFNYYAGGLRGFHRGSAPMLVGVACAYFLSLPLSYVGGFILHGGEIGLCLGYSAGYIVAACLVYGLFQRQMINANKC